MKFEWTLDAYQIGGEICCTVFYELDSDGPYIERVILRNPQYKDEIGIRTIPDWMNGQDVLDLMHHSDIDKLVEIATDKVEDDGYDP